MTQNSETTNKMSKLTKARTINKRRFTVCEKYRRLKAKNNKEKVRAAENEQDQMYRFVFKLVLLSNICPFMYKGLTYSVTGFSDFALCVSCFSHILRF